MKRNKRTPAARAYFRAFYEKNRIRYGAAMVLSILSIGVNLFVTWLLGEMIDIIAAGEAERLGLKDEQDVADLVSELRRERMEG